MTRHSAAILLGGGWLLLFNPESNLPNLAITSWKEVHEFATAQECELARRKEVQDFTQREHEPAIRGFNRYRCERVERVHRRKDRGRASGKEPGREPQRIEDQLQK